MASLLACGPRDESSQVVGEQAEQESPRGAPAIQDLPPAPSYPLGTPGHLVAVTAGDARLDGKWQAHAGLCDKIRVLELYATARDTGTVILLRLGAEAVRTYAVLSADSQPGDSAFARIGVQAYREREALGLRSVEGTLELTRFDDHVSGRFGSVLKEVQSNILTHFVGVFETVPLEQLGEEYCDQVAATLEPTPPAPVDTAARSAID